MSEKALRNIFLFGSLFFLILLAGMTVNSLSQVTSIRTAQLTDQVVAGKQVWQSKNCNDCHTILGIGGYYAPELTKTYDRRGAAWLQSWLADPQAVIPGTTMPAQKLSAVDVSNLTAFFQWVSQIDTNKWPPQPIAAALVSGAKLDGEAVYKSKPCSGCHRINGVGGTFGPDLTHIGSQPYDALPNTPEFLDLWLKDPAAQKPGTQMAKIATTDAERKALVEYLASLK